MKHASADVGLIFIAYNLKRILSIIGLEKLLEYLFFVYISFIKQKIERIDLKIDISSLVLHFSGLLKFNNKSTTVVFSPF